ncbi:MULTISPECIES: hypothetical protein [Aquimarina]|nr:MULTISPECIES: hypothetical protein [Aquimarina]
MTKKELYQYMLAYQQEHQFTLKGQSNFIEIIESLKVDCANKTDKKK